MFGEAINYRLMMHANSNPIKLNEILSLAINSEKKFNNVNNLVSVFFGIANKFASDRQVISRKIQVMIDFRMMQAYERKIPSCIGG